MLPEKQNVYVCIEIASREMNFKKHIQKILQKNKYNCVLDFSEDIMDNLISGEYKSGIVILKSIQRYTLFKLFLLRLTGSKIIYMEEEAWVPFNDIDIIRRRFPKNSYKLCSAVFTPNRYYYNLINSLKFTSKKIFFNVGSDRMSPKKFFDVDSFKNILFLGSYGALKSENFFLKIFTAELSFFNKFLLKKQYKHYYNQCLEDKFKLFGLMKKFSKKNEFNVSYRPHPSEKIIDDDIKLETNNIPVSESCKKYDLIIHSGSTSTFEIESGKVLTFSSKKTSDIHQNSKFHGPIAHSIEDIFKICNSNFKCIYNDFSFVNEFRDDVFMSGINYVNGKNFKTTKFNFIIKLIYKFYLNKISSFRRNNSILIQKRKKINEF